MGQPPNVTVRVEPGDEASLFYLRLAPKTPSSSSTCKIGLYLVITNNGTSDIHLNEVKVSFSGINIDIPPFNHGVNISKYDPAQPGTNEGKWGMIGGPKANGGEYIIIPYPPLPQTKMNIELYFENFDTPVILNRSLTAHVSPVEGGSYYFPGKIQDLNRYELWAAPETHWYGEDEIFAYDLKVISWNPASNTWSHIITNTDGTKNEHYHAWNKPVYALADGKVIHCVDGIEDNPHPDPAGAQFSGSGYGNIVFVQHGDDEHGYEIVRYAHLKNGSLNGNICNANAKILAGDYLGLVGNSGHTTDPHLHIHATKGTHATSDPLRPILFRDLNVIGVQDFVNPFNITEHPWVTVNNQGLPALNVVIWPSLFTVPSTYSPDDLRKWAAASYIIWGLIGDGPGLQVGPGGKPIPRDPWGPLLRLSLMKQDVLIGLAVSELASIVNDSELRRVIERTGIDVMSKAVAGLKKSLA